MTPATKKLPGWMITWLNSDYVLAIARNNPVLHRSIVLAAHQGVGVKVDFHDVYKNAAGVRPSKNYRNALEPTEDVRLLLGVAPERRYECKNVCLTVKDEDPRSYLETVAERLQLGIAIGDELVCKRMHQMDMESQLLYVFHEVLMKIEQMQRVARQGIITDSMPAPIRPLLEDSGLIRFLEEALIIISAAEKFCKGSGDGTPLYRRAAEKAGYPQNPRGALRMIGDNLFRDILPVLMLGWVAVLMDRDEEFMDRSGAWQRLAQIDQLFRPIVGGYDLLSNPEGKLEDLELLARWRLMAGDSALPVAESSEELRRLELKNWNVRFSDEDGQVTTERLGAVTLQRAYEREISFADLLVPLTIDGAVTNEVPLREASLGYLLGVQSKLLPHGEYLCNRSVRLFDHAGRVCEDVIGNFTVQRAWELGITYGDLLVNVLAENGQLMQMRLADLALPVLRSYKHIPSPLPGSGTDE